MFDKNQDAFKQLQNTLFENTAPVYLWAGAGLSKPAGIPLWVELKENLIERGRRFLRQQENLEDLQHRLKLLDLSESESDLWQAFDYIYDAIGLTEYYQALITEFEGAIKCSVPSSYVDLLRVKFKGVITTNIDKLVTRAFYESGRTEDPKIFKGCECSSYAYVLPKSDFFIWYLHGLSEDVNSLIMRKKDLSKLLTNEGYKTFLRSVLFDKVVVFVGVNPMDESVRLHLDLVRKNNCGNMPLYWITDNTSREALEFANLYNIRRIVYSGKENHKELNEVISLLINGKSYDDENPRPGYLNVPTINRNVRKFDSIDFSKYNEEEIRELLNKKAYEIVRKGDAAAYEAYDKFLKQYKQYIHNAWYVDEGSKLLGYTIGKEIGDGAFGRVFSAIDADGNPCAVKLLKQDVMRKRACLQSFRRGVRAMEILGKKGIDGVVKYKSASEIPAFVAMELIDGVNLDDVVKQRKLVSWYDKMRVLTEVGRIIKTAHALPECVLHRDIRPQNIMLQGYDYQSSDWKVCVLDFDLAFHKGSNEVSMQMASGVNGFLAPEQTDATNKIGQTRNGRVDSYGFAMLCYFVVTGKTPMPNQCLYKEWELTVDNVIGALNCDRWKSLPFKMAWLIKKCTSAKQSERLDLYQIYEYMSELNKAIRNPEAVIIPELVLDEFTYRLAVKLKCQNDVTVGIDGCRQFTRPGGGAISVWIR